MSLKLGASGNPRKWRFTWEAQSHIPTLKLFLFNSDSKPSIHCQNLNVQLLLEQSLLRVSWLDAADVFLSVPIPRVLVDADSPVQFRALDDHVEVKLSLLLPVDHPIHANFDSLLSLPEDESQRGEELTDDRSPLSMDSDLKKLSSTGEVQFCCRSCSTQLTSPLRIFAEMPSANWREVADNWFGACCCSFGGISEKLVARYAHSYTTAAGICLLSTTFIVICKDDLVGCNFPCLHRSQKLESEPDFSGHNCSPTAMLDNESNHGRVVCRDQKDSTLRFYGNLSCRDPKEDNMAAKECQVSEDVINGGNLYCMLPASDLSEDVLSASGFCGSIPTHKVEECLLETSGTCPKEQKPTAKVELHANQKSFLNGFLGDIFMARSANLSKDVQWVEFCCPQCSCLLGAYPAGNGHAPLDGGVRLFKCYISTCLPGGRSNDLFRKYTLEKMFTNQLLENANHELSFRTVVRDLQTSSPMLQIVLLNPSSFHCSGYCFSSVNSMEPVAKIDLLPAVKVLYSDCSSGSESQLRTLEDWVTKNQADEVHMLTHQIKELIKCLDFAQDMFPLSYTVLQGLSLSSMLR